MVVTPAWPSQASAASLTAVPSPRPRAPGSTATLPIHPVAPNDTEQATPVTRSCWHATTRRPPGAVRQYSSAAGWPELRPARVTTACTSRMSPAVAGRMTNGPALTPAMRPTMEPAPRADQPFSAAGPAPLGLHTGSTALAPVGGYHQR